MDNSITPSTLGETSLYDRLCDTGDKCVVIDRASEYEKPLLDVYRRSDGALLGKFDSIDRLFAANPEITPETDLKTYCKIVNFLMWENSREFIEDPEAFKNAYVAQELRRYDISLLREPYIGGGQIVFFVYQCMARPYMITLTYPFVGPEAMVGTRELPLLPEEGAEKRINNQQFV